MKPLLPSPGRTGTIVGRTTFVVVKRARKGEDEENDHDTEQSVFDILEALSRILCEASTECTTIRSWG